MSIHHPIGSHSGKGNVTIGTREDGQHHVTVRMIAPNTTATVAMLREAIDYIDPPSEYADGGVTCAAIEKEAEKPVPLPEAVMRRLTRERERFPGDWDVWIAQVKRDAAREALGGLAAESMGAFNAPHSPPSPTSWAEVAGAVDWYRARRYPKETP